MHLLKSVRHRHPLTVQLDGRAEIGDQQRFIFLRKSGVKPVNPIHADEFLLHSAKNGEVIFRADQAFVQIRLAEKDAEKFLVASS
jgi:hypothetical protein